MQQAAAPLSLKRRHEGDSGSGIPNEIKAEVDAAKESPDASGGGAAAAAQLPADGQAPPAKLRKLATGDSAPGGSGGGDAAAAAGQEAAGQAAGEARLPSNADPPGMQSRCAPAPDLACALLVL